MTINTHTLHFAPYLEIRKSGTKTAGEGTAAQQVNEILFGNWRLDNVSNGQ